MGVYKDPTGTRRASISRVTLHGFTTRFNNHLRNDNRRVHRKNNGTGKKNNSSPTPWHGDGLGNEKHSETYAQMFVTFLWTNTLDHYMRRLDDNEG